MSEPEFAANVITGLEKENAMRRGQNLEIEKSDVDYQRWVLLITSKKTDQPRTAFMSGLKGSQGAIDGLSESIWRGSSLS